MVPEIFEKDNVAANFSDGEAESNQRRDKSSQVCQDSPVLCFRVGQCLEACTSEDVIPNANYDN